MLLEFNGAARGECRQMLSAKNWSTNVLGYGQLQIMDIL